MTMLTHWLASDVLDDLRHALSVALGGGCVRFPDGGVAPPEALEEMIAAVAGLPSATRLEVPEAGWGASSVALVVDGCVVPGTTEQPSQFRNHYHCPNCDARWDDDWSCACDDRCPQCDLSVSPCLTEDLA